MYRSNYLPQILAGIALAVLLTADVAAGPLLGYVQLDNIGRVVPAGGGGVSEFRIGNYAASAQAYSDRNFSTSGILGNKDGSVFATCIEYDQTWDTSNRWYAIYAGLVDQPSATGDITTGEAGLIERVLSGEFGLDFETTGPESRASKVKALQALLWEAGSLGPNTDDFANGLVADRGTGGEALAEDWLTEYATGVDEVVTYALVTVKWDSTRGTFVDAGRQDFFTYGPEPSGGPGVPTPVPLLLLGVGLLAMRGVNRGRG